MGKYCLFEQHLFCKNKNQCSNPDTAAENLKMDFFKSVQRGKIKKVKKILEIGTIATNTNVIVNYKNPSDGSSPLHKATKNGNK